VPLPSVSPATGLCGPPVDRSGAHRLADLFRAGAFADRAAPDETETAPIAHSGHHGPVNNVFSCGRDKRGTNADGLSQFRVRHCRHCARPVLGSNTQKVAVAGTLTNAGGEPLPFTEVTLVEKGSKQFTRTNAKGEYRFYGSITGPATIEAVGVAPQTIPQPRQPASVMLRKLAD
jgi:hypothetical protein